MSKRQSKAPAPVTVGDLHPADYNPRVIDDAVLAMTTMRQIAGGQRNTRDRRNARATLTWLAALNTGGATERKVSA